jgi:hypothetical protein
MIKLLPGNKFVKRKYPSVKAVNYLIPIKMGL